MSTLLKVESLSQSFGLMKALEDVSLAIEAGSYTVLLGPSGSGKTTLLSILGGFLHPTTGRVLIRGVDCTTMAPAKRPTATVFQDYALFPHMSVGSNVAFGLRMKGLPKSEQVAKSRQMLELVGLAEAFEKKPHQLSGGQRQRVALARALVMEPAVLLLDEPLGALDLKLRRQMQEELKAIQKRVGTAFVHVTHDQEEAMALADHVVVMNKGHIEDQGPSERVYGRPATRFTATFMGESTILDGTIDDGGQIRTALGTFPCNGHLPGPAVHVAIRPEHVRLGPGIEATVKDVVYQGSFKRVTVAPSAQPGIRLLARLPADADVRENASISLSIDQTRLILLSD
jgi:spermidine/putrescine transport system ATP-binding protein